MLTYMQIIFICFMELIVQYMMIKLLIKQKGTRRELALVEDEELLLLHVGFLDNHHNKGNVYCGFISGMPSSVQGLFIKYDDGQEGFISFKSIHPDYLQNVPKDVMVKIMTRMIDSFQNKDYYENIDIRNYLYVGQKLLVQMIRESDDYKNPMFSTFISIGHRLSYIPNSITSSLLIDKSLSLTFKREIKDYIKDICGDVGSFSIKKQINTKDIDDVMDLWRVIYDEFKDCKQPKLIWNAHDVFKTIFLETFNIDKICIENKNREHEIESSENREHEISDQSLEKEIKSFWTDPNIIYCGNVFNEVYSQIKEAMSNTNQLTAGGYLLWFISSFGTMIDVNMGLKHIVENYKQIVLQVNFEAAQMIAKQIKLRNIGGLIFVDFLKMSDKDHQQAINDHMKSLLKDDVSHVMFEPINTMGVMVISRQYASGISMKNLIHMDESFRFKYDNLFD